MSPKPPAPKADDKIGKWTLVENIDSGGNADVWWARHPDHPTVAIKILRDLGKEPYARFRNEITALRKLGDVKGIVPMLDFSFPDGKGARPWYAMPLATASMEFLKGADSRSIVSEFIRLGETLTTLHAKKIAHRDIKPQNLLGWDGRLCFSDFGLVKYPDLTPITKPRRDVGAKFTMAPEMRREAAGADGLPADVFSFAKTLWIFLTGKPLSFDGPYVASSSVGLKHFLPSEYTTTLDVLLTDCTQHDPVARPSIEQVVKRLQDWRGFGRWQRNTRAHDQPNYYQGPQLGWLPGTAVSPYAHGAKPQKSLLSKSHQTPPSPLAYLTSLRRTGSEV